MANTQDYVSKVNDVIAICKDAEEGFHGAAKATHTEKLKSTFEMYSNQRREFAAELEREMANLGAEPKHPSGTIGKMHAGWIALKGALSGHSDHQILEETERGEDLSLKQYHEALASDVPPPLREILMRQMQSVEQGHVEMRTLRDASGKAA